MSFKERMRHARYTRLLVAMFVLPVIVVLSFLDVVPLSTGATWMLLLAFVVGLIVFFTRFKGTAKEG
ncbi:hypothetical protein JCM19037_398 [Geomicrobium sp. JCM 19037]|uniref:hypothetical protein n=1 Tax=Geomicrobium sp. JCM 19037 TaxID=1460634 RepID=UPI00045F4610|nr:hypothetical protein [Geomicrobium sp. JCM 19037]GAK02181.1 hypothetical protein JCM19037_398 [Geomicrobium sp. JCM 19037]